MGENIPEWKTPETILEKETTVNIGDIVKIDGKMHRVTKIHKDTNGDLLIDFSPGDEENSFSQ